MEWREYYIYNKIKKKILNQKKSRAYRISLFMIS
jgi:hypothetical protein